MAEDSLGGVPEAPPVTIKKYANRRLYDTSASAYVTLEDVAAMVRDGIEFAVHDAKTGDDITRSVLTQIIVEEEAKGRPLLPISFLRQLIMLYGDSLQSLVPQYLDVTMRSFANNQERIRDYLNDAFDGLSPFNQIEEIDRQNMRTFEQSVTMFAPPARGLSASARSPNQETDKNGEDAAAAALEKLRAQLGAMQRQLDALSRKGNG